MKDKLKNVHYLCFQCARKLGGTWPDGHVATQHEGACNVCGELLGLCNVGDYDWPDGKARGMRD